MSNARRIIFTALAIVSFAFVVYAAHRRTLGHWDDFWAVYSVDPDPLHDPDRIGLSPAEANRNFRWDNWMRFSWEGPLVALLPMLFLAMSEHNSPWVAIRDRWLWIAGLLVIGNIICACGLGEHNGVPAWTWNEWRLLIRVHGTVEAAREAHYISPLWLLLPIILTTAFVIFGAWLRAVQTGLPFAVC